MLFFEATRHAPFRAAACTKDCAACSSNPIRAFNSGGVVEGGSP